MGLRRWIREGNGKKTRGLTPCLRRAIPIFSLSIPYCACLALYMQAMCHPLPTPSPLSKVFPHVQPRKDLS